MKLLNRNFLSIIILLVTSWGLPLNAQRHFSFFAIGDMPYHNPADLSKFQKLITAINSEASAFTIHVGDIKNGQNPCGEYVDPKSKAVFSFSEYRMDY